MLLVVDGATGAEIEPKGGGEGEVLGVVRGGVGVPLGAGCVPGVVGWSGYSIWGCCRGGGLIQHGAVGGHYGDRDGSGFGDLHILLESVKINRYEFPTIGV